MLEQLGIHFAQPFLRESGFPHEEGTTRNIERHARKRLVHGGIGAAVPANAAAIAQSLGNRLAQRNRAVLGRVVLIDMQIASHLHGNVDQRVTRKLFDHMIEEADPGGNVISPHPVEVHFDENVRFLGLARNPACTHGPPIGPWPRESIICEAFRKPP